MTYFIDIEIMSYAQAIMPYGGHDMAVKRTAGTSTCLHITSKLQNIIVVLDNGYTAVLLVLFTPSGHKIVLRCILPIFLS